MIDEEIEKALAICGDLSTFDCKGCPCKDDPLCFTTIRENTIDYIHRLKAENAALSKESDENNSFAMGYKLRADRLEKAVKLARKETAKEILQMLTNHRFAIDDDDGNLIMFYLDKIDFRFIFEKYGVEVKDE